YVVMTTALGYIKRTRLSDFDNIRSNGIIAATIEESDQLIDARLTDGKQQILLTSAGGMAIRFDENDVRPMGRTARGVRGLKLGAGDALVSMTVLYPESDGWLLTMCANGFGKRTPASEYRSQNRAGKGLITIKVTERNGPVVATLLVRDEDQIMVVTSGGKVIRTPVAGVSQMSRNTQGVRVIRTTKNERVVAIERLIDPDDADTGEANELVESVDGETSPTSEASAAESVVADRGASQDESGSGASEEE
ncbi:MAG TPA: DNA gyrase subunit A, partial [Nannocystis exedens]|nr:DNA gyrase subunit A [Nannocystis exedens]